MSESDTMEEDLLGSCNMAGAVVGESVIGRATVAESEHPDKFDGVA